MSRAKQAFYENHSGSSILEINRITGVILAGHVFYIALRRCGLVATRLDELSWGFVCYVFNVLLAITVYSGKHSTLLMLYGLPPIAMICLTQYLSAPSNPTEKSKTITETRKPVQKQVVKHRVAFLSVYRATMMITTVLAILAVDLPLFPRRYAKTETWGTSLMDLGVGSFVFSSGVVNATQNFSVLQGLRSGVIVLTMGIARALMVRGTGYHEHISEYGVHWNFFITLALLPPLLPAMRRVQRSGIPFLIQGILLCATYQLLLLQTSWQSWIVLAYRDNLLSANKEGLSSFVGYLSIFLLGLDAGSIVLSRKPRPLIRLLLFSSMAFVFGYYFTTGYLNIRASRRIANAPYIMWVAAHNTSFLLSLAAIEKFVSILPRRTTKVHNTSDVPIILDKINSKGLYVFLGANLLTGAINLLMGDSMMTTKTQTGLAILIGYSLFVCLGAVYI
jgi:glucosaminylphosphatidylinositol acyltransferase